MLASIPYSAYAIIYGRAAADRSHHADFDAACQWIAIHATPPRARSHRHPGEVFWQTGQLVVEPDATDPDVIDRLIDRLGVAYLLIDEERYINAGLNPLGHYVEQYQRRVALVWSKSHGRRSVRVFEIVRPK